MADTGTKGNLRSFVRSSDYCCCCADRHPISHQPTVRTRRCIAALCVYMSYGCDWPTFCPYTSRLYHPQIEPGHKCHFAVSYYRFCQRDCLHYTSTACIYTPFVDDTLCGQIQFSVLLQSLDRSGPTNDHLLANRRLDHSYPGCYISLRYFYRLSSYQPVIQ